MEYMQYSHSRRESISQNIVHHLWDRATAFNRRNLRGTFFSYHLEYEHQFYRSIPPNVSVQNIEKPLGFLRKFTPDGKWLLSISHDQCCLEIYEYNGVAKAAELLKDHEGETVTDDNRACNHIREQIFNRLFKLHWRIRLAPAIFLNRIFVNREFSIFLENGRYVLVVVSRNTPNPHIPVRNYMRYPDLHDEIELFDYNFLVIDILRGTVVDAIYFSHDSIAISHNQGVAAFGNNIAFLSRCRQSIEIVKFVHGKFVHLCVVGPHYYDPQVPIVVPDNLPVGTKSPILSHIKQSVLADRYREILQIRVPSIQRAELTEFYKNFNVYERMIMTKMQFIDNDHIFIRFEEQSTIYNITPEESDKTCFKLYAFYCLSKQQVIKTDTMRSVDLLYILSNHADDFRNSRSLQTGRQSSSPSNSEYVRTAFKNYIASVKGDELEAALRLNPTAPINTQSYSTSPYLDYKNFHYDERAITAFERPRNTRLYRINFADRYTDLTSFRFYLTTSSEIVKDAFTHCRKRHELVYFIFHPYEPFAISVQNIGARLFVNFHLYNPKTNVKKEEE